jgi:hypothetical protein
VPHVPPISFFFIWSPEECFDGQYRCWISSSCGLI